MALSRLAYGGAAQQQADIIACLKAAPVNDATNAAMASMLIRQQLPSKKHEKHEWFEPFFPSSKERVKPASLLAQLTERGLTAADQLLALVRAGTNDEVWNTYHEAVATCIYQLLQQRSDLLRQLLDELETALTEKHWIHHRIVLAALALCAASMPALFNMSRADVEQLLLRASTNAGSFNSRRFAITTLSYLRVITSAVLEALLRLVDDTSVVQEDVIAAAQRFNRLDASLSESLPPALVQALHGPSSARAYVAIKLLEALGTSAAAEITPGIRRQIVAALADALHDEWSHGSVWLYKNGQIVEEGTIDQHLYTALLRVAGLVG